MIAMFCVGAVCPALADDDRLFWHPEAGTPTERFELAKRTRPELIAFLRRFPKGADLHNHAGGAVYSDYVIDEARVKDSATTRGAGGSPPARKNTPSASMSWKPIRPC